MAMEGAAVDLVRIFGARGLVQPESLVDPSEDIREMARMSQQERDQMGERGWQYLNRQLAKAGVVPRFRMMLERAMAKHA